MEGNIVECPCVTAVNSKQSSSHCLARFFLSPEVHKMKDTVCHVAEENRKVVCAAEDSSVQTVTKC